MLLLIFGVFFLLPAVLIQEPFTAEVIGSKWIVSKNSRYTGTWSQEKRTADFSNGTISGLVPKSAGSYHAISTKQIVNASGENFVIQFENKIQATTFGCGGSYLKLLNEEFEPENFNNTSPYVIMFGPDKCVETNQIHFIYRTQNPLSKLWSEHKLKTKVPGLYDNITHLYTLIIRSNDTFEIKLDNVVKASGSLHDNATFDTPFEPPKLIPDASEKKPADWVDAKEIPDANDSKPADWNETEPQTIPDPKAVKPDDWNETESPEIPDVKAEKPAEWDEKEDGVYSPGLVSNPYCENHGCGKWYPPQIKNPKYKGKWKPRNIPNPKYIGEWKAKDVENPFYFTPSQNLFQVGKIYGVGFELVSPVQQWFGNIFVDSSATAVDDADKLAKEKWAPVNAIEVVQVPKDKADADAAAARAKAEADTGKSDWRTGEEVKDDAASSTATPGGATPPPATGKPATPPPAASTTGTPAKPATPPPPTPPPAKPATPEKPTATPTDTKAPAKPADPKAATPDL